ncbi:MAG: hypothetical protein EXQ86_10090 [Rhodospirillales bacterium]|nr:hypothetical protein [Rhodospirillales bacterium]
MTDPIKKAIAVLNEALELDRGAITDLVNMRVECNARLAAHPTIQTGVYGGARRVGVLGLLNGALGDSPSGVIGAKGRMDDTGHFHAIERFVDLREEKLDTLA